MNNKFNVIGNGILCGVVETSKQAQTTTATTMLEKMNEKQKSIRTTQTCSHTLRLLLLLLSGFHTVFIGKERTKIFLLLNRTKTTTTTTLL